MKKIMSLVLVLSLLLSLGITASAATATTDASITYRGIKLVLDGKEVIPCDAAGNTTEPFIMGGTTYLPLRAVAQALGLNVKWIPETSTVELTGGGEVKTGTVPSATSATKTVKITYRDIKVVLDGVQLELKNANGDTVEPFIMDGTTYLPLRIIGEALDLGVNWDAATSTVGLVDKNEPEPEDGWWIESSIKYSHYSQDGSLLDGYTETNDFDEDGYQLGYSYVSIDGSYYNYEFDKNGNILLSEYDNGNGVTMNKYEYNAEGLEIYHKYSSAPSSYTSETWFTYDDQGRCTSEKWKMVATWGTQEYTVYYTYEGNTRYSRTVFADGEGYAAEHTLTKTYDDQGRLIKKELVYEGGLSMTYEYEYDANGNETLYSYTNSEGDWEKTITEYDENGNLLLDSYQSNTHDYTYKYTYDEQGRMFKAEYSSESDGAAWVREIIYDASGNYLGYDRTGDNGKRSLRVTYGADGRPVSAVEDIYGVVYTYEFSLDANGNVVKAVGSVSDGTKVVYEYEYTFLAW